MKAAWLQNRILSYRDDVPAPEPGEGEALVRVRLAGICGTDLELVKGYYPFTGIPGHEFVGKIILAPDQPNRVDERVVGEINVTCGTCRFCLDMLPHHCENRKVTVVIKSTYRGQLEFDFSKIVVNEITLVGSRCGPFELAMDLLMSGKIDPILLIEQTYPLEDASSAFDHASRPGGGNSIVYDCRVSQPGPPPGPTGPSAVAGPRPVFVANPDLLRFSRNASA